MNVSQLMRQFMREMQGADPKALELKVGQVVKGMVVQLLSDQEALMNIGGHLLKAKLETPLQQGQTTMLQVQPNSTPEQLLLKPMQASAVPIAEESMPDLLKQLGFKDTPQHRQLVQLAHQAQVPLTKVEMKPLQPIVQLQPEGAESSTWMKAGLAAHSKGLPLTADSIKAMQQIMFGQPIHHNLKQVGEQAAQLLQQITASPNGDGTNQSSLQLSSKVTAQLQKLVQLVGQISSLSMVDGNEAAPTLSPKGSLSVAQAAASVSNAGVAADVQDQLKASSRTQGGVSATAEAPQPSRPSSAQSPVSSPVSNLVEGSRLSEPSTVQNGLKNAGIDQQETIGSRMEQRVGAAPSKQDTSGVVKETSLKPEANSTLQSNVSTAQAATAGETKSSWIGQLLKSMGMNLEQQLKQAVQQSDRSPQTNHDLTPAVQASILDEGLPEAIRTTQQQSFESLKQVLLQLQAEELPPALKESTQQLLQQVTGQQLMLVSERTGLFSHMTLMLPLRDGDSEQTASIHIQSRKGRKGEMDAENCRLLFDLSMKSLGNTLIDVQVVNKIVNLQIHNDHPMITRLVELGKEDIQAALQQVGYHCASVKVTAYPAPVQSGQGASGTLTNGLNNEAAQKYKLPSYKGVDLKV